MLFRSGGEAEWVARRLACCLAGAVCDARIEVHDKHNAAAHRHFAVSRSFPSWMNQAQAQFGFADLATNVATAR